jgi:hypothetical protein
MYWFWLCGGLRRKEESKEEDQCELGAKGWPFIEEVAPAASERGKRRGVGWEHDPREPCGRKRQPLDRCGWIAGGGEEKVMEEEALVFGRGLKELPSFEEELKERA